MALIEPVGIGIAVSSAVIIIWAFSDIFSKRIIDILGAREALLFNQATSTASFFALLPIFFFFDPLIFAKSQEFYWYSFVSGIANSFAWIAYFHALEGGKLSIAQPLTYLWPFVTFSLAIPILGEKVTFGFWVGSILALLSIYLIAFSGKSGFVFDSSAKWGLLAMLLWGFSMFFTKPIVDEGGIFLPVLMTRIFFFPAFLPYYFLSKKFLKSPAAKKRAGFPLKKILILGAMNTASFMLYNVAVKFAGASIPALISSLAPAVVLLLSVPLLGEHPSKRQIAGVVVGVLGLITVSVF